MTVGVCIYLWGFHPVLLIYMSLLWSVAHCLGYCRFSYSLKSGSLIPLPPFVFLKFVLCIWDLMCCHIKFYNFCSNSLNNTIGNLKKIQYISPSVYFVFDFFHHSLIIFTVKLFCFFKSVYS